MKPSRIPSSSPHRLIVEGPDDQWSIVNLMAQHGCDWAAPTPGLPYVSAAGGVEAALEALPIAAKSCARVGVVLDADDVSPASRLASFRDRLGLDDALVPAVLPRDGLIIDTGSKRLGLWLMPDNERAGKLEDFLGILVPQADACWPHALEATRAAKSKGAPFADKDEVKARIHSWLAWQERPGMPFGQAISARVLDSNAATALRFVAWFRRLFLDP